MQCARAAGYPRGRFRSQTLRRVSLSSWPHYRWRWWPKPGGGVRLLEVPRPRLKALQRRVLNDLLDRLPLLEAACGFVRGRGLMDHAARHAGQAVLLHFDLRDFFGSVPAARVHAVFATLGYPPGVCRVLTALLTSRVPESVLQRLRDEGLIDWAQAQRLRDAHLPQGAPTSPALANLCTFGLDLRLEGLAHVLGARYSRYADDLVLSGPPALRARAAAIEVRVGAIVRDEGFHLNHRKTRVGTQAGAQRVCGVVVNEHPNLPRRDFDRLKALLHRCAVHGPGRMGRAGQPGQGGAAAGPAGAHRLGAMTRLSQSSAQAGSRWWRMAFSNRAVRQILNRTRRHQGLVACGGRMGRYTPWHAVIIQTAPGWCIPAGSPRVSVCVPTGHSMPGCCQGGL